MTVRPNRSWLLVLALLVLCTTAVGCLKRHTGVEDEDEGKSFIVGRWAFRRLEEAEKAIAEGKMDVAKDKLAEMQENEELTPHERALMWQRLGNIYAEEENYPEAIKAFSKCLELDALPSVSQQAVQFNIGQLYAITGDYKRAVEMLEGWIKKQKAKPSREIQLMLANCYVQLGQYKRALPYAEAVMAQTEQADENLLQLLLAIRFELKQHKKVAAILTELVERFPKKAYWLQLSAAHSELGDHRRSLAVLELAYRQGLLTEESELVTLAQQYLALDLPYEAATLIEKEQKAGRISKSQENLELLSNAWMAAREIKRALRALDASARKADSGEPYMRLGQLQIQQQRWAQAVAALERALKRGGLKHTSKAYLLLGNARYELGKRQAARQAFQRAAKDEETRVAAERWLESMRQEDESCPTGNEPACKLLPGHS